MKTILIDCDDVLLQWSEGFRLFFEHRHQTTLDPRGNADWDLKEWLGLDVYDVSREINEFNLYSWEFGCLPPIAGAIEAIKKLNDLHKFEFVVISSCSTNLQTIALRRTNLFHIFGDVFKEVHCVELGESKSTLLADYFPTFWIEDNVKNALLGLEYGHTPIVIENLRNVRFKNETKDRVTWCKDWEEIESTITMRK